MPKTARFDTRWPLEQKELFEYASKLGGFRNLSEFVFLTVLERAREIVKEHNQVIASDRDKEIFFDTIMNPPGPNEKLKRAVRKYKKTFGAQ